MELSSLGAHLLLSPAGGALIPDLSDLQFAFTSYQGHWGLPDLTHSLFIQIKKQNIDTSKTDQPVCHQSQRSPLGKRSEIVEKPTRMALNYLAHVGTHV